MEETKQNDKGFFKRADAHIFLSNDQINEDCDAGKVSASFMYATARFNAWICARGFETAGEMLNSKEQMMEYFVKEYTNMLEQNLNEYIENFDAHMNPKDS